jgi:hypothetical protein
MAIGGATRIENTVARRAEHTQAFIFRNNILVDWAQTVWEYLIAKASGWITRKHTVRLATVGSHALDHLTWLDHTIR